MKLIALTRGKFAQVDDEDFEHLSLFKWYACKCGEKFYAHRGRYESGKHSIIPMHAQIMGTPMGMHTDHKDGDGLNNTRGNLRVCTHSQNLMNRGSQRNNTSGFKGVGRCAPASNKRWRACIQVEYRQIWLGRFTTAELAARAYDEAALKHHGKFALLNFPAG